MVEAYPDPNVGRHLLAEARMQTYAEPDPYVRSKMLAAAITAGDTGIDNSIVSQAYSEIEVPEEWAVREESDAYPTQQKNHAGRILVKALAGSQQFETAYHIALDLNRSGSYPHGLSAFYDLLEAGYAGPNNELLHIVPDDSLYKLPEEDTPTHFDAWGTEAYLTALTAYGIPVMDPQGPYHTLFNVLTLDPWRQQSCLMEFAVAAAAHGEDVSLAMQFKDAIDDPRLRAKAGLAISRRTQDRDTLIELLEDINACQIQAANYTAVYGRSRAPEHDVQEIALGAAGVYVRLGAVDEARKLLQQYDDNFHFTELRLEVYTDLYDTQGDARDRETALRLLNDTAPFGWEHLTPFVKKLSEADLKFGRALPSLTAEDEVVPLLAWEVQAVYGGINTLEKKWIEGGLPDWPLYAEDDAKRYRFFRNEAKNETLAALVSFLAERGSMQAAQELLGLIDDPTEAVRAKTAIALKLS